MVISSFLVLSGKCVCHASRNLHIYQYDGESVSFPAKCQYILSKSTKPFDACAFRIDIDTHSPYNGTYTANILPYRVSMTIANFKITLGHGKNIYVSIIMQQTWCMIGKHILNPLYHRKHIYNIANSYFSGTKIWNPLNKTKIFVKKS